MSSWRGQRGEGKAGCIFWILLLVIGGYLASQVIPRKINDMHLKDFVNEMAENYPRATDKDFEREIMKRAKDLDIPLEPKNLDVEKNLRRVQVKLKYTVPINLFVTTYPMTFEHNIERDIFIM